MKPARYDLRESYAGDTYDAIAMTFQQDGAPMDLSDAEVSMVFFHRGEVLLRLSSTEGEIAIDDPTTGQVRVNPFNVPDHRGTLNHKLRICWSNGTVRTLLVGNLPIMKGDPDE